MRCSYAIPAVIERPRAYIRAVESCSNTIGFSPPRKHFQLHRPPRRYLLVDQHAFVRSRLRREEQLRYRASSAAHLPDLRRSGPSDGGLTIVASTKIRKTLKSIRATFPTTLSRVPPPTKPPRSFKNMRRRMANPPLMHRPRRLRTFWVPLLRLETDPYLSKGRVLLPHS